MAVVRWELRRQNFYLLKRKSSLLLKFTVVVFSVLLFCEFLIYYLVIFQCHWPKVKRLAHDHGEQEPVLKAMFLADTHLLGEIRGHWLDRLRREWQMERAFQTALWLLQPEVVFILGDIFDEGKWSSAKAWEDDVQRFQKMFRLTSTVQLKVVVGNHDIGFHYQMSKYRIKRFEKVFNSERLFSWKGVNSHRCPRLDLPPAPVCLSFVMVNSVAMEGDGCSICSEAEAELLEISHKLNCSRKVQGSSHCEGGQRLPSSAPVLLQLLWWLQPRLVLSGHTHSACEVLHPGGAPEVSIPSFSWRNRNNPSFIMGSLTSTDYALSKCYLPFECTVLTTYCAAAGFLVILILAHFEFSASSFLFGWKQRRMHMTR
ncbi:metallophosphoesterase 1 isoform X6 [Nannospalax galili]|uniref:metallophosphoesterase 1 isoform X6 n=1 Tax=Nannospalax galili TaxID=1026970 RepID=UPI00111C61C9|nr:metallophosphoesterase 1 isoform X6 [Nannospalax galili]